MNNIKSFIFKTLFFAVITLAALAALDYPYSQLASRSSNYWTEQWADIMGEPIDAEILVLGNSRAAADFMPSVISDTLGAKTFILGSIAGQLDRQSRRYKFYRVRNKAPKLIIFSIDYLSLMQTDPRYGVEQFFPYLYDKAFRDIVTSGERLTFAETHIPMWRYHGLNPLGYIQRYPRTYHDGFMPHNAGCNFFENKIDTTDFHINEDEIPLMWEREIESRRREGVKMVFVYPPLHELIILRRDKEKKLKERFQQFSLQFGIPILDFSDMWIRHDNEYFCDPYHLNPRGAEVFSDSLARALSQLNILKPSKP